MYPPYYKGKYNSDCETCSYRDFSDGRYVSTMGYEEYLPGCITDQHPHFCGKNIIVKDDPFKVEQKEDEEIFYDYDFKDDEEKEEELPIAITPGEKWGKYLEEEIFSEEDEKYLEKVHDSRAYLEHGFNHKKHYQTYNKRAYKFVKEALEQGERIPITSIIYKNFEAYFYDPRVIYFILQCLVYSPSRLDMGFQYEDHIIKNYILLLLEYYKLKDILSDWNSVNKNYQTYYYDHIYCETVLSVKLIESQVNSHGANNIADLNRTQIKDKKLQHYCYDKYNGYLSGINKKRKDDNYLNFTVSHDNPNFVENLVNDIFNGISYEDFVSRADQLHLVKCDNPRVFDEINYFRKMSDEKKKREEEQKAQEKKNNSCYITTAISQILGYDDNCEELNALRSFRTNYMLSNPKYIPLLIQYHTIGPVISRELLNDKNQVEVATYYFKNRIQIVINLIKDNQVEEAIQMYTNLTTELINHYGIQDYFVNMQDIDFEKLVQQGASNYDLKVLARKLSTKKTIE